VIDVRPEFTVMPHTEVGEKFGGRGLATRLVREALDDLRSRGDKIVALCPLVVAFVRKHPEYADLLARPLD
jgi:predicted GNAT family acetyltransferase